MNTPESREIKEFKQFAPPLFKNANNLVDSIFGRDIELLADIETGERKNFTSLLKRLYGLALDPGLKRKVRFEDKAYSPVAMLNRSSFLHELRRRAEIEQQEEIGMEFNVGRNFRMLNFDLKNLRGADQVTDSENNKMADVVLNLTAAALNKSIQTVIKKLGINPEDILVGRYGGDEFYIALIGNLEMAKTEGIKEIIIQHIEKNKGLFLINGNIEERNIEIKDGKINEIDIPEEEVKRKLFLSFLQRGLVLTEKELERDRDLLVDDNQEVDRDRLNSYLREVIAHRIYPDEVEKGGYEAFIEYITRLHPEMRVPFNLAADLDKKEEKKGEIVVTRQLALLSYIENYLVDPLLDEIIISRFDLLDHLKRGEFSRIYGFEVKVKEINDHLSYATGDEAIISLWKSEKMLKSILGAELNKVRIGRFAGTIFVAVKNGQALSPETEERIKSITNSGISGNFKGIDYTLPVGFSDFDVSDIGKDTAEAEIKARINRIFDSATENWNENVLKRLVGDSSAFSKFINLVEHADHEFDEDIFALLTARYFTGARWEARITKAYEVLNRMETASTNNEEKLKFRIIREALDQVFESKKSS